MRLDARRDASVDLADDHRAAPAVVNHARLEVVRAEVHERADRSLAPTTSAIASSLSPFCAETTQPSAAQDAAAARATAARCDAPSWRG